ncbi:MAG TPA: hypothetical protein V6C84_23735 [Coleofasciculaceae cyanobacterium]|jgi:hypothetical protein
MSLPKTQFSSQPSESHFASTELTDDNILVAVASQFSKLLQAHKLSVAQTDISSEDMARVDTIKQAAIAKIILLLTAYYRNQGWNPQDIKTSVLNMLDQPHN